MQKTFHFAERRNMSGEKAPSQAYAADIWIKSVSYHLEAGGLRTLAYGHFRWPPPVSERRYHVTTAKP